MLDMKALIEKVVNALKVQTYSVTSGIGTLSQAETWCKRVGRTVHVSVRVTSLPSGYSSVQTLARIPTEIAPSNYFYFPLAHVSTSAQASNYGYLGPNGYIQAPAGIVNASSQLFCNFTYTI